MKLQQYLLNHYLHIDYEEFSAKVISAKGILVTILNNPLNEMTEKQKEKLKASIAQVQEIIETTDKDTQISLFILDRNIIPEELTKKVTVTVTKFERIRPVKGEKFVTLSQDQIQNRLCNATLLVHEILMEQLSGFSDQMFMDGGDL